MTQPWETLERVSSDAGVLELRRRGADDFLICVDGRVLMASGAHRSESALATLACAGLAGVARPLVLIGGLGMGFSLRAALDVLPADAAIVVAEINPSIVSWCKGALAARCQHPLEDPRVEVVIDDVARVIERATRAGAKRRFHALILDLYEGPHAKTDARDDPFYGSRAIASAHRALAPGGVLAVWGEDPDAGFQRRLQRAGFSVRVARPGRGGRRHAVTLATRGGGTVA